MKRVSLALTFFLATVVAVAPARAQAPGTNPPSFSQADLDRIVSPIALYPDPLLAQVLAASTFPDDIAEAASWADGHSYLTGDSLSAAITDDQLPWDPSVQALLPFPSVLEMMSRDMGWTQQLGDAVLADRGAVMDAVQRLRRQASSYGYLRSNPQVVVTGGPYIQIMPAVPASFAVPIYDPRIVFAPPRRGFAVGGAIRFGQPVRLGPAFSPWGWSEARLAWPSRTMIINRTPWTRTWANRRSYVHPYAVRRSPATGQRAAERHELRPRSERARNTRRSDSRRRN
jgi:hypothetical protein